MRPAQYVLAALALAGCNAQFNEGPAPAPAAQDGTAGPDAGGRDTAPTAGPRPATADAAPSTPTTSAPAPDASSPPPPAATDPYGTLPSGGGIKDSVRAFEDRVYALDVSIAPADWDTLNKNAEAYDTNGTPVPAMVRIDGQDVGKIGIRYKGAWGTFRTCLQGATGTVGGVVPARPLTGCTNQFPFKLDFAAYEPDKRWNGLKKVNLHSMLRDPSKLRDKLTYGLFRAMGIATARGTHAKLTLTVGSASVVMLTTITENVGDGHFTKDHWPADAEGNMYKQGWPRFVTAAYWQPRLETNASAMPPVTHDKIIAFSQDVYANRTKPDAVLTALQKWSDVGWLARFIAVDTVSNDVDGTTKFWCRQPASASPLGAIDCSNNNYYWYQTKGDKFLLIPWDTDYTWWAKPDHYVIPAWDNNVADCGRPYPLYGADHMAPSCDPIFRAMNLPAARALYLQAIKDMLAGPLDVTKLQAQVDRWAAYLKPAIMATTSTTVGGITINAGIDAAAWSNEVATVKTTIQTLRDRIAGVVDGKPFRP